MKPFAKVLSILLAALLLLSCTACSPAKEAGTDIRMAVLSGPTGIGASILMEQNENGETANHYTFTVAAVNDEVTAGLLNGSLDIAAVATNVASNLYNKSEGDICLLALNTLGVLYILENGDTIHSVADLAGKTILSAGQGANPEFVLAYILTQNGLTYSTDGSEADVQIEFKAADEITAAMVSGSADVCLLPVPAVTAVLLQNQDVRQALDLTEEWNKVSDAGALTMGSIVARREFVEAHPEAVALFLEEYAASIEAVLADPAHAGEACEAFGIVPKAAIAAKAIPACNLVCITGEEIRPTIEPYYEVLFAANPASIGGAMPGDDFYYTGKQ